MTLQEFSQSIKAKYPEYKNIDDTELATKMLQKYPSYKSQITDTPTEQPRQEEIKQEVVQQRAPREKGVLEKFGDVAGKTMGAINKFTGIESAIDLLGAAGEGFQYGANKLFGNEAANKRLLAQPQSKIMRKATEKGTMAGVKDVAGKSLEVGTNLAAFATGAAPVAQAGKLAQYAGYAKTGAKFGGAFAAGQSLQENKKALDVVKDTLTGAAKGAAVGVAIPAFFEGSVRAAKNVASLYSGVPKTALEIAFRNPEKVGEAARRYAKTPEATKGILEKANKSFDAIKEARSADYDKALEELTKSGYKPKADQELITKNLDAITKKFNTKVLAPGEVSKLEEIQSLYQTWDDYTPLGLNELRQAVRNRTNIGNSKKLNSLVTQLEGTIRDVVNKADPKIAAMNKNYADASDFINSLQKDLFGQRSTLTDNTKLNRLLTTFNQKSDIRQKLIEKLGEQGGQDLINEITGAAMSTWLPANWVQRFVLAGGVPSLAGAGVPTMIAGVAAASPRVVGKTARLLGQADKALTPLKKYAIPLTSKLINKVK